MTKRNRNRKPSDPMEIMRQVAERRDRDAEITRLKTMGAIVTIDNRNGRILGAYRSSVFKILLESKAINQNQFNAAQELVEHWAMWKGLAGSQGASAGFVDGGTGCVELVTDRMIKAGKDIAKILAHVGPMDRELIEAFMVAVVEEDRAMVWRGIVMKVTGISQPIRQSQVVVSALENLRRVMEGTHDVVPIRRRVATA